MKNGSLGVVLVVSLMVLGSLGVFVFASAASGASSSVARSPVPHANTVLPAAVGSAVPASPAPKSAAQTFPRTVMIESFTAEWCEFCPNESQAIFWIAQNTSRNVIDISELHQSDSYSSVDATSSERADFYKVTGIPDVVVDGRSSLDGDGYPTMPGMKAWYQRSIDNASAIPGNVFISQNGSITSFGGSGHTVSVHVNITSGISGSYNAITYLLQYIGKNISTTDGDSLPGCSGNDPCAMHPIGWVVRESLMNHPITLTQGLTTEINETGKIDAGWDALNLSTVTFVQQNSTKIIENSNWAPVSTLVASVSSSSQVVPALENATITVREINSSTALAVAGANVTLTATGGGSFSRTTGVTAANGTFTVNYTAPRVTSEVPVVISAQLTTPNYTAAPASVTVWINPVDPPTSPSAVGVSPGPQSDTLNLSWTPPASGGGGVAYHVYRSTSQGSGFTAIGTVTSPSFEDTGLANGQTYWYSVSAANVAGFSLNTTAIYASPFSVVPQGLSSGINWSLTIDSLLFNSTPGQTVSVYLSAGTFAYEIYPATYAWESSLTFGNVTTTAKAQQLTVTFTPRDGILEGTISPDNASISVNGTAVSVVGGAFLVLLPEGFYPYVVTAPGYKNISGTAILTPGNISTLPLVLSKLPTTPSIGSVTASSGLPAVDEVSLAVVAVAIAVALALVLKTRRPKGGTPPRGRSPPPPTAEEP
jgi:thiol-disulfide isomerase/thioredoxin